MAGADKVLGEYSPVSVGKAYEKVKESYPAAAKDPRVERVELQYEFLKLKDKIYFYPVWVFEVRVKGGKWEYHLMDAITGDYFKDIPEELRQ